VISERGANGVDSRRLGRAGDRFSRCADGAMDYFGCYAVSPRPAEIVAVIFQHGFMGLGMLDSQRTSTDQHLRVVSEVRKMSRAEDDTRGLSPRNRNMR